MKLIALPYLLCHHIGHTAVALTVHGYATHSAEDGTKRPEEPKLLHHKATLKALGIHEEDSDDKIPITSMWCKGNDILIGALYGFLKTKAHTPIEHPSAKSLYHSPTAVPLSVLQFPRYAASYPRAAF